MTTGYDNKKTAHQGGCKQYNSRLLQSFYSLKAMGSTTLTGTA